MEKSDSSSIHTDPEKGVTTPEAPSINENTERAIEPIFLSGIKLYLTLSSVILVGFLITLDASIVVTVRVCCLYTEEMLMNKHRQSQKSPHTSILLQILGGMAALT